jgi:amidase
VVPGTAVAGGDSSPPSHEAVEHPDTGPVHDIGDLDLDAATIPDLQARMDAGELTSVDLTSAYLDRIHELDDDLGAVLSVNDEALDQAFASDHTRAGSGARSPLEGIPVLLKDNVDTADQPATAGSRALIGSEADDATISRKLLDAGAIIIGKANLSEWANFRADFFTSGWSAVGGQTNNPYVLDRNPCGSSSGSAVGVAASLAQVAIGTETDGSIVCPSGANSAVGLKPTLGAVSRDGIVPISAEQDTAGPIARHAIDAALLLEVVAGPDEADAATLAAPADLDTAYADLDLEALQGARVGVVELTAEERKTLGQNFGHVLDQAVRHLEKAGATVVPVSLPYQDEIGEGEFPALLAEFHRDIDAYLAATPGDHPTDLAGLVEFNRQDTVELSLMDQGVFETALATAKPADDPAIVETRARIRDLAQRSIDETLAQDPATPDDDLVAIVALTNNPAWVTHYQNVDGLSDVDAPFYGSSGAAAVAGYPNVSVPAGFAGPQDALPVGLSFFGTGWDDADLLDLAADFEDEARARQAPQYLPSVGD